MTTTEDNKALIRRVIDEVMNGDRTDGLEELFTPEMAKAAAGWTRPFRRSFPDMAMEVVRLVAEGDTVVGHFRCSATHRGAWLGHEATGRRFENVDEVYFFTVENGRIAGAWGIEDNESRKRQLGV